MWVISWTSREPEHTPGTSAPQPRGSSISPKCCFPAVCLVQSHLRVAIAELTEGATPRGWSWEDLTVYSLASVASACSSGFFLTGAFLAAADFLAAGFLAAGLAADASVAFFGALAPAFASLMP